MDERAERYVHVLLFECSQCDGPVTSAQVSEERSLEKVDGQPAPCQCNSCGWSGSLVGLHSRQHWVEPWNGGAKRRSVEDHDRDSGPSA